MAVIVFAFSPAHLEDLPNWEVGEPLSRAGNVFAFHTP